MHACVYEPSCFCKKQAHSAASKEPQWTWAGPSGSYFNSTVLVLASSGNALRCLRNLVCNTLVCSHWTKSRTTSSYVADEIPAQRHLAVCPRWSPEVCWDLEPTSEANVQILMRNKCSGMMHVFVPITQELWKVNICSFYWICIDCSMLIFEK